MQNSPAFKITALEAQIDRLEKDRRQIETMMNVDELEATFDLKHAQEEIDALEAKRREEESKIAYGETGVYKEPIAREYEVKLLKIQRNYLFGISISLALIFIYFIPTNFYLKSQAPGAAHSMPTTVSTTTPSYTAFSKSTAGLPSATGPLFVQLKNGDTYDITAAYVKKEIGNKELRMLAYNGSVPGPFIKVTEGSSITVNFVNNTDIDQTLHSHGLRLNNLFDGVPGETQNVVKPGERFTYTLDFPDAGVAWYHPHTREDYGQELGLYGNYIVSSPNENYWSDVNREIPLIIDDILIENNQIADFYKETVDHALIGRFGNTYLVNGEVDGLTEVKSGEVIRLLITNVSNTRTYKLSIPGAQIKLVGAEWGRYEQEEYKESFLISPAERSVVEVYFPKAGLYKLTNNLPDKQIVMSQFVAKEETAEPSFASEFNVARRNAEEKKLFDQYRADFTSREPEKKALLTVQLSGAVNHGAHNHAAAPTTQAAPVDESQPHAHGAAAMPAEMDMSGMNMMTGVSQIQWDDPSNSDKTNTLQNVLWKIVDEKTGKTNMAIDDWTFTKGQLVKIRFTNDMTAAHVMQHPIHFHGQRFVVLATNGVPNQNMVWKDTTLVAPGEYIDILVEMSNTGVWMTHCHIAEHLHAGMMMSFRVQEVDGTANGDDFRKSLKPQSASMPVSSSLESFTFDSQVSNAHLLELNKQSFRTQTKEEVVFTFKDGSGNGINLDQNRQQALRVWFISRDGSDHFLSYPGNTQIYSRDGMMNGNAPGTPGFDESKPHSHSLNYPSFVNFAYADVGHDHGGMAPTNFVGTYTVPAYFALQGEYKAFAEYYLSGETEPRIAAITFAVGPSSWSYDSLGFSANGKWWSLLIISLALMIPMSLWVRKYINSPIK